MPVLPMFPLQRVLLPGEELTLRLFEPRYLTLLDDCLAGNRQFGVVLIERGSEVGGGDVRTAIGTTAQIVVHRELADGSIAIACRGTQRFRVVDWLPDDPYPRADVQWWPDGPSGSADTWDEALCRVDPLAGECWDVYAEAVARKTGRTPHPKDHRNVFGPDADADPSDYTFGKTAVLPFGEADRYRVLAAPDPLARADVMTRALAETMPGYRFRMLGDDG